MRSIWTTNKVLGAITVVLALVGLLVWIPLDTETGILEQVRRKTDIGDAFAPTVADLVLLAGGILLLFEAGGPVLTRAHVMWLGGLLFVLLVGLALIRWTGPVAAFLLSDGTEYRLLRDTWPWKYLGLLTGSVAIVAGLIALVEGRLSLRGVAIAFAVAAVLIGLYDLPFDDLLLPPNGDV